MRRAAQEWLSGWKSRTDRKPLIIRGARQVGKTWLMKEFGRTEYKRCAYVNFDSNRRMRILFESDLDVDRILAGLRIETDCDIDARDTLIVFDEVQECPAALVSLKYFCENAGQYHIVAAGSLLGVALHEGSSFPVGKVEFLDLFPLDYTEFLMAMGKDDLVGLIAKRDPSLIHAFKDRCIDLLRQYYFIGGMPEVVASFVEASDYAKVREIQIRILESYQQDFSKHASPALVPRLRMLWNSIPSQLARENKKFVYGLLREGARAKDYEAALTWLCDCGLAYKVDRISKPGLPLRAYEDIHAFKLFMFDIGLLGAMSGLDVRTLLEGNALFEEYKGSLSEQYVLQQMKAMKDLRVFYWSAERSDAEVDFLVQAGAALVPIEVKAAENLRAKSLKSYRERYSPPLCVRASMSDYRRDDWLLNLPLYMISALPAHIKEGMITGI